MLARLRPRNGRILRRLSSLAPLETRDFLQQYKIRSSVEALILHYSSQPLSRFSMETLLEQSRNLDETVIADIARDTIESLLAYNARRLRTFRNLPYLVMLNPAISESYSMYLHSMSVLLQASLKAPRTLAANEAFVDDVLAEFMAIHADALPTLSKGFAEVSHLMGEAQIKAFLDQHLVERISMRLVSHQHIQLTESLRSAAFVKGGDYNGVIKNLNLRDVIQKNADTVNDIFLMKYDQTVPVVVDTGLRQSFWSGSAQKPDPKPENDTPIMYPYIEYHLDYILRELFKNSFRAHIENGVSDPVQVTVSTTPQFMEMRIRDKGKGIPPATVNHMFDYSFTTWDSGEGDSFKTLNSPPGVEGNTVAGMGYGLPLSKNYIEIFNDTGSVPAGMGSLSVQTYWGWGTDVYLKTVGTKTGKDAEA